MKFCVVFIVFSLFFSCEFLQNGSDSASAADPYFITGETETRNDFLALFNLLSQETPGSEGEFVVIREIAASFARIGDFDRLIHFLGERTINNPSDPYNAYYLMMIAYAYIQLDSLPIAAVYFDRIVNNYPDLTINDESIHLISLLHLIELNQNPKRQVWYYQELISRFPDKIDLGTAYFMLGQASEQLGDWSGAIRAYAQFMPFAGTIIQGFPNAYQYAKQQVDFSRSAKDWTYESLPALRQSVENALDTFNARALERSRAKVNFFARSWGQTETDDGRIADFSIVQFMHNRIGYAPTLDPSSTATEAWLRTTGWSVYMPIWYLYFRKIYFPQDPEIHGRWEWAGIYYGEKF